MFLDDTEGRGGDSSGNAERRGKALGESRLTRAKVALEADDVARLQIRGKFLRQFPRLLDAADGIDTGHRSAPR